MTLLKKCANPNFQHFATKGRYWSFQANITMDLDMQKGTFMIMIMIYELLRRILGKVRRVMKINEESYVKTEENLGKSEESQRKNEESYDKTVKRMRKCDECFEENEESFVIDL